MRTILGELHTCTGLPRRDEFLVEIAKAGRPVLFTRAIEDWPARATWNLEWLERQHGHVVLKRGITVRDWIARLREVTTQGKVKYLNVQLNEIPGLEDDVTLPRYHRFESMVRTELWVGPGGSRTPVHCDFAENIFFQVSGRKRFQLYTPDAISKFRPALDYLLYRSYKPERLAYESDGTLRGTDLETLLASEPVNPVFDFVIEGGEALYLPYGWYHRVSALDFSFSLSSRWTSPPKLARRVLRFAASKIGTAF